MSSQSYSSSTSFSYSSSNNGQATGHSHSEQVQSGPHGTQVVRETQNLGEPAAREVRQFDTQGRELVEDSTDNTTNRITDAEQAERDRQYDERIEEEYAKREGGA